MPTYFFQIELQEGNSINVDSLPSHQEYINHLFSERKLLSYFVSESNDFFWCIISAEDEPEAMHIVSGFPLQPKFKDVHCTRLQNFHTQPLSIASISLN